MTKKTKGTGAKQPGKAVMKTASATQRPPTGVVGGGEIDEVLAMIVSARLRVCQAVNTELVDIYSCRS